MKKVCFLSILSLFSCAAFSQINKGQWLVGGTASFSSNNQETADLKETNIEISPNLGYFILNKLAAGVRVGLTSDRISVDGSFVNKTKSQSIAPFIRYYLLPNGQKVNVLLDASYQHTRIEHPVEPVRIGKANGFSVAAGPAFFLTPNVALEFTLGYSQMKQQDSDYKINTFKTGLGFQIHLGK